MLNSRLQSHISEYALSKRSLPWANAHHGSAAVLKANLPKSLSIAKLSPPETAKVSPDASTPAYSTSVFSDEFLQPILMTLTAMTPRPSLAGCSKLLTATNKFTLLAATNGGAASTRGLFERALGKEIGGEGGPWGVFSCDQHQVAKPAPAVYEQIWQRFEKEGLKERKGWFIASHTWDLFAAKKAGLALRLTKDRIRVADFDILRRFKTAWVAYEEFITCESVYGRPDVVAVDLEDAARQIIALEK